MDLSSLSVYLHIHHEGDVDSYLIPVAKINEYITLTLICFHNSIKSSGEALKEILQRLAIASIHLLWSVTDVERQHLAGFAKK